MVREEGGPPVGVQAINGVIDQCERPWSNDSNDCKLEIVD
jgi:hypothetical protein